LEAYLSVDLKEIEIAENDKVLDIIV